MHGPQAMLLAFIVGLFLAVQMINYKTLWAPLVTHASYNGMSVLDWECLSGQWNPVQTTPVMLALGAIATALAFVGIILSIFLVVKDGHRGA